MRRRLRTAALSALLFALAPGLAACGVYAPPLRPSERSPEGDGPAASAAAPAPECAGEDESDGD